MHVMLSASSAALDVSSELASPEGTQASSLREELVSPESRTGNMLDLRPSLPRHSDSSSLFSALAKDSLI
jgi:hypothetical protein